MGGGGVAVEVKGLGKNKNSSKTFFNAIFIKFILSLKVLLKASFLSLHHLILFKFH